MVPHKYVQYFYVLIENRRYGLTKVKSQKLVWSCQNILERKESQNRELQKLCEKLNSY
jgi:hypothetical protein